MSDIGGVILGALIAGPITYFYSKKLILQTHQKAIESNRITEFNKAAATFHAEFSDVLFYLRQNIEKSIGNKKLIFQIINTKDLVRYERAVVLFEPFVDDRYLHSFRTAWRNCKEYIKATEEQWADSENPADTEWAKHLAVSSDKELNLNQKYLEHIKALLEYAKRK